MIPYSICITTFSKRFNLIEKLVSQIRSFTNTDILIAINGDYTLEFNNDYRKKMLNLCSSFDNIYPIFFPEMRGISKLWNTLVIHSKQDWCLVLNDDIEITTNDIFEKLFFILDSDPNIYLINNQVEGQGFSHFIVHKKFLDAVGYFDERFLGFGCEDGDLLWRYEEKYQRPIQILQIHGILNLRDGSRDENIQPENTKYTKFNKDFCMQKYIPGDGAVGSFGQKMKRVIPDESQYPYEKFFKENIQKL